MKASMKVGLVTTNAAVSAGTFATTTLVARARARLPLATSGDPLQLPFGVPVFPQPMSRELAPEQLLPGVRNQVNGVAAASKARRTS
jgi:hypothetical protein